MVSHSKETGIKTKIAASAATLIDVEYKIKIQNLAAIVTKATETKHINFTTLNYAGFILLLHKEVKAQVCDATYDAMHSTAGYQIKKP